MKVKNHEKKLLQLSDIGYHGKPVDKLTKQELQTAFLEVVQQLSDCVQQLDYREKGLT